jgi:2-dehydro-3-deoxyphosphooctonate aldolase (KDO 8-P synthase)
VNATARPNFLELGVNPAAGAAMAVAVDGIFLETHPNPAKALCDGPTSLHLRNLESVLKKLQAIFKTHQQ